MRARAKAAVLLVAGALALSGCGAGSPKFKSSDVTGAGFGRDFALTDRGGKLRTLADYRGKVVVLFFGYTQCPDVCPTTLAALAQTMKTLGADASRVQVVFVTVDPDRDTGELARGYVTAFDPSFVGPARRRRRDRPHGEGIQDPLPEAAGPDAGELHGRPLGGDLRVRSAGPAAPLCRQRAGPRSLRPRHPRAPARAGVSAQPDGSASPESGARDTRSMQLTLTEAFARAFAHERAGRKSEARTIYADILAAIPDHPGALLKLAEQDIDAGSPDAARARLDAALAAARRSACRSRTSGSALRDSISRAAIATRRATRASAPLPSRRTRFPRCGSSPRSRSMPATRSPHRRCAGARSCTTRATRDCCICWAAR